MSKTFRVFVSSTFSDLKEERDALQTRVFKPLREFCAQHGARFQAIDLRWGVSEEASRDQQTMNICLGEIKRCQQVTPRPNFVILLGERYGWCPPPAQITGEEFDSIIKYTSPNDREIIQKWYRRDDNAIPAEYILQPWDGYSYEEWGTIERELHSVLLSGAKAAKLEKSEMFKYWSSATHQEIAAGVLSKNAEPEHVFAFIRKINGLPDDEVARDYLDFNLEGKRDIEAKNHLNTLKSELDEVLAENVKRYETVWRTDKPQSNHIEQLCKDMLHALKSLIGDQLHDLEEVDPLDLEISEHKSFGKERSRSFIGRQTILEKIDSYISGQNNHPLAIWGQSGSGKSALVGKAVANAQEAYQDAEIVYRFIGATPESSSGRAILESLCRQVSRLYGVEESDIPLEFKDLVQELPERISLATEARPLVIFIDALNQLGEMDNAKALTWIPTELPENVRFVVSTLPGICLDALKNTLPDSYLVELKPLSFDQGNDLLDLWLNESGRKLQSEQRKEVIGKFNTNGLPLYLKLAYEEARRWKSYSTQYKLKSDIYGVIEEMFDRLSEDANHGKVLFSHALGYLAAAKNGLSENEILDVLSRDDKVMTDFFRRSPKSPSVDRLPVVVWSRLYTDLEPYLTQRAADGTNLLSFYHPTTFGKAVRETFLSGDLKTKRHRKIANYFDEQPLIRDRDDEKEYNYRKLSELPYQQASGHMWDDIQSLLTNFEFLQTKVSAVNVQPLIEDYSEVFKSGYSDHGFLLIKNALELASHILAQDDKQLPGQLIGRLMMKYKPVTIRQLLDQANNWKENPWFKPLTPSLSQAGGPLIRTINGPIVKSNFSWSILKVFMTPDGQHAVSYSKNRTLAVWNLESGEMLHSLDNEEPLGITLDAKKVVSRDKPGSLRIWDLETGRDLHSYKYSFDNLISISIMPEKWYGYSQSEDNTLKIWNLKNGEELCILEGHMQNSGEKIQ